MSFTDYLEKAKVLIQEQLRQFLSEKKREDIPESFKRQKAIESLEEFVLRGKLIRGTLFLLAVEYFGVQISEKHIKVACAIELVHSALLIQDDIIDNDAIRRGEKSIHTKYRDIGRHVKASDPSHYGVSIAIVISDIAFFLAFELLSSFEESTLGSLLRFYSHEIYLVALAEGIDSEFGQTEIEPTEDDIYSVYHYKTARYTFSMPFVMAGVVSSASSETVKQLEKIGELAGTIFQLKDDVIGIFGSEEVIGKPVGSDIRENKKTLIRVLLYKMCDEDERKKLDMSFGNPNMTNTQLEEVVVLAKKYSIEEIINEKIKKIADEQNELFEKLPDDEVYRNVFADLLVFNLKRTY